ncbi:MAG: hypothetical protein N2484_09165 [Clostridia bacterium]|nr:hypothetical protein [Clostridia bacterium]
MLINVPNDPDYYGLEKGDTITLMHEGRVLGTGKIYSKYNSLVVLDVDAEIWRAYNMELASLLSPFTNMETT